MAAIQPSSRALRRLTTRANDLASCAPEATPASLVFQNFAPLLLKYSAALIPCDQVMDALVKTFVSPVHATNDLLESGDLGVGLVVKALGSADCKDEADEDVLDEWASALALSAARTIERNFDRETAPEPSPVIKEEPVEAVVPAPEVTPDAACVFQLAPIAAKEACPAPVVASQFALPSPTASLSAPVLSQELPAAKALPAASASSCTPPPPGPQACSPLSGTAQIRQPSGLLREFLVPRLTEQQAHSTPPSSMFQSAQSPAPPMPSSATQHRQMDTSNDGGDTADAMQRSMTITTSSSFSPALAPAPASTPSHVPSPSSSQPTSRAPTSAPSSSGVKRSRPDKLHEGSALYFEEARESQEDTPAMSSLTTSPSPSPPPAPKKSERLAAKPRFSVVAKLQPKQQMRSTSTTVKSISHKTDNKRRKSSSATLGVPASPTEWVAVIASALESLPSSTGTAAEIWRRVKEQQPAMSHTKSKEATITQVLSTYRCFSSVELVVKGKARASSSSSSSSSSTPLITLSRVWEFVPEWKATAFDGSAIEHHDLSEEMDSSVWYNALTYHYNVPIQQHDDIPVPSLAGYDFTAESCLGDPLIGSSRLTLQSFSPLYTAPVTHHDSDIAVSSSTSICQQLSTTSDPQPAAAAAVSLASMPPLDGQQALSVSNNIMSGPFATLGYEGVLQKSFHQDLSTMPFSFSNDALTLDSTLESPLGLERESPYSYQLLATPLFDDLDDLPPLDMPSLFPSTSSTPLQQQVFAPPPTPLAFPPLDAEFTFDFGIAGAHVSPVVASAPHSAIGLSTSVSTAAAAPVSASLSRPAVRHTSSSSSSNTTLTPLDAPIQPRSYLLPSATARKRRTSAAEKLLAKRGRTSASPQVAEEGGEASLPQEVVDAVERKRLQNTLSARKSRQRKQAQLDELEATNKALNEENSRLLARIQQLEGVVTGLGLIV